MRDEPKKSKLAAGFAWGLAAALLLLVAYPLSFGPFLWLGDRGVIPESIHPSLDAVYEPIDVRGSGYCRFEIDQDGQRLAIPLDADAMIVKESGGRGAVRRAYVSYLQWWQPPVYFDALPPGDGWID